MRKLTKEQAKARAAKAQETRARSLAYPETWQEARDLQALALDVVQVGYRALAQRMHPDKGGTPKDMARLTAARALLLLHIYR
jgi:hypothetical protein